MLEQSSIGSIPPSRSHPRLHRYRAVKADRGKQPWVRRKDDMVRLSPRSLSQVPVKNFSGPRPVKPVFPAQVLEIDQMQCAAYPPHGTHRRLD
ncbi:MAG: hypothetical protein JO054_18845 [Actinobacteria bacterium]|nr:hypothetical protein [Actinomycetota bacterium]